jgi:hypothetical protein
MNLPGDGIHLTISQTVFDDLASKTSCSNILPTPKRSARLRAKPDPHASCVCRGRQRVSQAGGALGTNKLQLDHARRPNRFRLAGCGCVYDHSNAPTQNDRLLGAVLCSFSVFTITDYRQAAPGSPHIKRALFLYTLV